MPIYDYACKACGHEFEREQRISEAPVRKCPACGKHQAKRLISRTSFLLKGGGWYSDLYASSRGGAEKASNEGGGEAEAAKGDGAKAEKSEKAEKSDKAASAKSGGEGKSAKKPSGGGKAAA